MTAHCVFICSHVPLGGRGSCNDVYACTGGGDLCVCAYVCLYACRCCQKAQNSARSLTTSRMASMEMTTRQMQG